MESIVIIKPIEQKLHFDNDVTIEAGELTAVMEDNRYLNLSLSGQIQLSIYEKIEQNELFHFKLSIVDREINFAREPNLDIKINIIPDLLNRLFDEYKSIDLLVDELKKSKSSSFLLNSQNWLILSLAQQQESTEVRQRTFWDYLDFQQILEDNSEKTNYFFDAIANFILNKLDADSFIDDTFTQEQLLNPILELSKNHLKQNSIDSDNSNLDFTKITDLIPQLFAEYLTNVDNVIANNLVTSTTADSLLDSVLQFFEQNNWRYEVVEDNTVILNFVGDNGQWTCYARVEESLQQFLFYSILPSHAPKNKKNAISEFINRVNFGMNIGNFEMDFEDGEIRYRTAINLEGIEPRSRYLLIQQLVYGNVIITDRYFAGIMAILYANMLPLEAVEKIERNLI